MAHSTGPGTLCHPRRMAECVWPNSPPRQGTPAHAIRESAHRSTDSDRTARTCAWCGPGTSSRSRPTPGAPPLPGSHREAARLRGATGGGGSAAASAAFGLVTVALAEGRPTPARSRRHTSRRRGRRVGSDGLRRGARRVSGPPEPTPSSERAPLWCAARCDRRPRTRCRPGGPHGGILAPRRHRPRSSAGAHTPGHRAPSPATPRHGAPPPPPRASGPCLGGRPRAKIRYKPT